MEKTIELDCPPGLPRPDQLIKTVIEGTGLPEREASSHCFGNWLWNYEDVSDETWKSIQSTLQKRIMALYQKGLIRYGSW